MFLVLVPTVFQGNFDSVCGDEECWSIPWSEGDLDWDKDDHPGHNGHLSNEGNAPCIVDANLIDCRRRRG